MMKYLLVEDERFAYEEMKRMMEKLRPDYQLEAWTATVEQTVQFLKHHPVDLMLLDIRLTDGNSFDIFEQIQVTTPVIFTTATTAVLKLSGIHPATLKEGETAWKEAEGVSLYSQKRNALSLALQSGTYRFSVVMDAGR